MAPALRCEGLTRRFGSAVALDGLTLDAEPGEVLALLGPNGAGKTTTVRLLDGILRPDAGRAEVLGLDPATDGPAVRARTGVLTEQAGLDDRLSAVENVTFHAVIRGIPEDRARIRAMLLLERFGMAARADSLVQGFSTGQRRRVGLARALVHDPEVLFLDEPTSGLDPEATRATLDLIAELAREQGSTVLLCTHFLGEAGRLADRMAVLSAGRLLGFGRPDDLGRELGLGLRLDVDLGGPADAALVRAMVAVPGVVDGRTTDQGAELRLETREAIPGVAAAATAGSRALYGLVPRPATLEDVYFAVTADGA